MGGDDDAGASRAPGGAKRARARRVSVAWPVGLYDGKQTVRGELQNLSAGGAFVAIEPPIPTSVGLSFWVPLPGGPPVLLRGHVRWTRSLQGPDGEPVGVGIQFYDPDSPEIARVRHWMQLNPPTQRDPELPPDPDLPPDP